MTAKKKAWKPKKPFLKLRARSKRLEVRPYSPADYQAWHDGHAGRSPSAHRYDGAPPSARELTPAAFRKRLRAHRSAARARAQFNFGVFERQSGQVVGLVGYYVINPGLRWANLGYGVHNQHWGRGYGPEAARLCLKIGFDDLNFHRIEASCELGNKPSAKTALRAGLRREGVRKKHFSRDGGVDMLVFAQNQIDYKKKKKRGR